MKKASIRINIKGSQILIHTMGLVEYFGPILFHSLFYYFSGIYGYGPFAHTQTQKFAFWMVILHFVKREYECLFVHKSSKSSMPVFSASKSLLHYWGTAGILLGYFLYVPTTYYLNSNSYLFKVNNLPSWLNYGIFATWAFAEFSNFKTHRILAKIRRGGNEKKYAIPFGYGFDQVSCPHYFFESLGWLTFSLLVGQWSAWFFFITGTGQMVIWAVQKHNWYQQNFGDEFIKLNRKIYIPYII